ncbi:MAG: transketolase C-terminal domain-containing protein [Candidatus Altiarchaeota archaeon]
MVKIIEETSHAVAEAVKAVNPGVIAAYPITPQTHIVERISDWVANGELPSSEYIRVESEFSAISACLGASATGVRTYTSSSSQGLALMHEVLFIVSGMRLPVGMTCVNRSLSAPINIWNDHSDSMAERDSCWLQFHTETAQESYDLTLMQYKISENHDVMLPSMVCLDGFTLSHVYEPVSLPTQEEVDKFLPLYKPFHAVLDPDDPLTLGPIAFPEHFMEFRKTQEDAINGSLKVIEDVFKEYTKTFPVEIENSRPNEYWHFEKYLMEDAEIALVAMGSMCGTIKCVVDKLREKGEKVGLLKLITYRPFPKEELKKALKNVGKIAVLEKAFSAGSGGILYHELGMLFYEDDERPKLRNFIVGLGGRDVLLNHIEKIYELTNQDKGQKEEWVF